MNMRNGSIVTLAGLLVAIALPAFADSLADKKMHADQEADLADRLALTNQACGSHVTAKIDWSTFGEADALKNAVTPYCAAALDAIEDICSDTLGKQAVTEKVKTVTCAGASAPAASFADGALTFSFSLTPNQNKLLVRDYLEKSL
jgi:hypothetical protein